MPKRTPVCSQSDCEEPPQFSGLCREHYEEQQENRRRREAALQALHYGQIDGRLPDDLELRDELQQLRSWWDRACFSVNHQVQDSILQDEAQYAVEWCISLAQEIVAAEQASRAGQPDLSTFTITREWVWKRFSNLQAGYMSNGVKRPVK